MVNPPSDRTPPASAVAAAAVHRAVTRAARPARTGTPPLPPPFDVLDGEHRATLAMLDSLQQLLARLDAAAVDEETRRSAAAIVAFFEGPGREHHAREEAHVFPLVLNGPDAELAQQVRRLQQDHGWLDEDWRELKPQIEAIAQGHRWYDTALLRETLPVYAALHREHIALEETVVYPAVRRQRQASAAGPSGGTASAAG